MQGGIVCTTLIQDGRSAGPAYLGPQAGASAPTISAGQTVGRDGARRRRSTVHMHSWPARPGLRACLAHDRHAICPGRVPGRVQAAGRPPAGSAAACCGRESSAAYVHALARPQSLPSTLPGPGRRRLAAGYVPTGV
jgi:hypothetical protein